MFKAVATIRTITLLLAVALTLPAYAHDITVTMPGAGPYCASSSITVDYSSSGLTFNANNIFTVQLSNESGSFSTPVIIGTLASKATTGSIDVTFPANASGTAFRLRVVASDPSWTGLNNGYNFAIIPTSAPSISITADPSTTVGPGSVIYFTATVSNAGALPNIEWKNNGVVIGSGSAIALPSAQKGDEVVAVVTSDGACAAPPQATSNTVNVDVNENLTQSNHAWLDRARQPDGAGGYFKRKNASGFSIGVPYNKVYIGCGSTPTETYRNDFWEYDPVSDVWTQRADLGTPDVNNAPGRYNAVGFSIQAKGYIGTGRSATGVLKDFYQYDPSNNTWLKRADLPPSAPAREQAFGFGIVTATSLRGYLGGGYATGDFSDFYEFNPGANSWTAKAPFPGGKRLGAAAFTIDSKGYVAAGYSSTSNTWYKDFWEYDQPSGIWTARASMPGSGRTRATAFALAGNGYVGLGYSAAGYQGQFYQYVVSTNSWNQRPYYPGPNTLTHGVGLAMNNRGYIYKDGTMIEYNIFNIDAFASKICSGERLSIHYDASGFVFGAANKFTMLMSANQSFSVSSEIGKLSTTNPTGTINSVIPASATGTYYVKLVSDNPALSTLLETIVVHNIPAAHVVTPVDGTAVCSGVSVTFNSTLGETTGYQWYKNDLPVGANSPSYTDDTLEDGDKIKATRVYVDGCSGPVNLTSTPITMVVHSATKPTVAIDQPNMLKCSDALRYQWYKDGEEIPAATDQSYTMTGSGVYKVRVADGQGCYAFSDDLIDVYTGLEDKRFQFEVLAYPTPSTSDMYLSVADDIVALGCHFTMMNELGQIVISKQPAQSVNKLDMSGRAAGIYILRVSFGENTVLRRVVKVH